MHIGVIFYIIILNLEVFFIIKLIPGPQTIPLSPLSFRALSQSLSSPLCSLLFSQVTQQRAHLSPLLSLSISLFPSLLSPFARSLNLSLPLSTLSSSARSPISALALRLRRVY